jgi:hypothetical protein
LSIICEMLTICTILIETHDKKMCWL